MNSISDKSAVELQITGDVAVDLALVSSLQISDAYIHSQDGVFVLDIKYFKTDISLLSLLDVSVPEMDRVKASANLQTRNQKVGLNNLADAGLYVSQHDERR